MKRIKAKKAQFSPYMIWVLVISIVVVLAGFTVVTNVLAQRPGGGGPSIPGQVNYEAVSASDFVSTISTSFVVIPDMSVSFETSVDDSVVLMFSGEVPFSTETPNGGCGAVVRMVVDGTVTSNEIRIIDPNITTFNFIIPNLGSGSHTAQAEWRVFDESPGGFTDACVNDRSLTVLHK